MKKFLLLLSLVFCGTLFAAGNAKITEFVKVDLVHDGIPDEVFWNNAGTMDNFRIFKNFSRPASAKTTVKLCMDAQNVYLALICDEPDGVNTGNPASSAWSGDNVEIFFASLAGHDWLRQLVFGLNGKSYTEFADADQLQWKSFTGKDFWSAELIIPRSQLGKFGKNDLRFNMMRYRKNIKERQTLCDLPWAHDPEKFITLDVKTVASEITHGPWPYAVTTASARIGWETAGLCDTALFYRKKGEHGFLTAYPAKLDGLPETLHHIDLTGLAADTVYEYHFSGNNKLYTFRTLAQEPADFSFAMISDTHCRSKDMQKLLATENIRNAELLFHLGDLASGLSGRGSIYDAYLDTMVNHRDKFFHTIRGNHEFRGLGIKVFDWLFNPFEKTGYGMFSHKGVCFVILDTDGDMPVSKDYLAAQQKFLFDAVKSAEFRNAQFRVLIAHHPLFDPSGAAPELVALFKALPADAQQSFDLMCAGHIHRYEKLMPGKALYSTLPHRNGKKQKFTPPFPVMSIPQWGYFLIEKYSDKMVFKVFSPENTVLDSVTIPRK